MNQIKIKDLLEKKSSLWYSIYEITFNTKGLLKPFLLLLFLVIVSRGFIGLNAIIIASALDQKITGSLDFLNYIISFFGLAYFFFTYKIIDSLFQPLIMFIAQKTDTLVETEKIDEAIVCLFSLPVSSWSGADPKEVSFRLNVKEAIRFFFYCICRNLIPAVIEIFIAINILFYLNINVQTWIIMICSILYVYLMLAVVPTLNSSFIQHTKTEGKMSSIVLSLFENSRLAKSYNAQSLFTNKFKMEMRKEDQSYLDTIQAISMAEAIPSLLIVIGLSLVFYISFNSLINKEITIGLFSGTLAVSATILSNLKHLSWAFGGIMHGHSSISFPMNILRECRNIHLIKEKDMQNNGELSCEHITLTVEGKEILKNISFNLKSKEKVWLVGSSGAGKTTLLSALNGLVDYSGDILFNNERINDRPLFAWVPQSSDVLTGTLRFNLLIGNQQATEDEMWSALDIVGLKDLIQDRGGLNINIENELSNFSGGEKQRIAIARAIISKRPILIMDEPSSALDIMTEKALVENIVELPVSAIISVHRIRYIPFGARVIVMDNGKIVQDGILEELSKKSGRFKELLTV